MKVGFFFNNILKLIVLILAFSSEVFLESKNDDK
jgi:hypothetical protein